MTIYVIQALQPNNVSLQLTEDLTYKLSWFHISPRIMLLFKYLNIYYAPSHVTSTIQRGRCLAQWLRQQLGYSHPILECLGLSLSLSQLQLPIHTHTAAQVMPRVHKPLAPTGWTRIQFQALALQPDPALPSWGIYRMNQEM